MRRATRLGVLAVGALALAPAASAATLVVDPGGGGDHTTIQAAIDAASPGDTILVMPGTYVEDLIVPKPLVIAGAGIGQTILLPATSVPGSGQGSQVGTTTWMIRVQSSDVSISGFTLHGDNPALPAAIDARGGIVTDYTTGTYDRLEVVACEVTDVVYRGIYAAAGGTGHRFLGNTVRRITQFPLNSVGIFFFGAVGEATGNFVEDCSIAIGFQAGGGGTISGNTIYGGDLGILANGSTSPVTIASNLITAAGQGIQTIALQTTATVSSNTTLGCTTGHSLFGLGTGSVLDDGNTYDGQNALGTSGIFATTDVSPWGFGDLTFTAVNNVFARNEVAVYLDETVGQTAPILSCTLSGSPATYNTFTESGAFDVYLDDCDDDVAASDNFWGKVSPALIEAAIWHQVDDPALGLVDFANPVALLVTVDDDGPADFPTINPAVQAILPGATIRVMPGLYVEDVVVDRSCLIEGSGTDPDPALGTVLRGASVHPDMTPVTVTGPDVVIRNLRVDGQQLVYGKARRGILGTGTSGLVVEDCVVHTAKTAIAYVTSTDGLFVGNEVYDFGVNLQEGGGIFLWNSTGTVGVPGHGNLAHDGLATGFIFHNSSAGEARDDLARNCPLGFLSNGAAADTLFEDCAAEDCTQGFQGIGNHVPVTFRDSRAEGCTWGFSVYGLGHQLHTFERVQALDGGHGFYFSGETPWGDDDTVAQVRGSIVTGNDYGIVLEETPSSAPFLMDVNLDGSLAPNWIAGNAVSDITLAPCDDDIEASFNYFGSVDPAVIESHIHHQVDDPSLGLVTFGFPQPSFVFCEAKIASPGCVPSIGATGIASASASAPFTIHATQVVGNQPGLLFYGLSRREIPFMGGTLCAGPPLRRTPAQTSGGTPGTCEGAFTFDFNAWIQSGSDGNLGPGVSVVAQYWYRDPGLAPPDAIGLTDAVTFTIEP